VVIVDDLVIGLYQITGKQDHMGTSADFEVGLVQDDHIELLGKLMMQHVRLVNAGLDLLADLGCHLILFWELVIVELVAILPGRAFASIGPLVDKMKAAS